MSYKTCENCGCRVYKYGCVNCDEREYISMQDTYGTSEKSISKGTNIIPLITHTMSDETTPYIKVGDRIEIERCEGGTLIAVVDKVSDTEFWFKDDADGKTYSLPKNDPGYKVITRAPVKIGDLRHHLINGICGIRASEQALRAGYTYQKPEEGDEYFKVPVNLTEHLDNLDEQIKRIMKAFREYEQSLPK